MDRFYLQNELPSSYKNLMDKLNKERLDEEIIKPLVNRLRNRTSDKDSQFNFGGQSELLTIVRLYMDILFLNIVQEKNTIQISEFKDVWNKVMPKCATRFTSYLKIEDYEIEKVNALHTFILQNDSFLGELKLASILEKYSQELNYAFYGYEFYPSPYRELQFTPGRIYSHKKAAFFESFLDKKALY